ncbi:MAG: 2-oxoacid:acceptor oxidoreductase family protein [Treponemataceae bacterium]
MENSVLIAGFGGQGIILIGQLLGYSATSVGKNATFYPAYGAEQRGGTANCTVVISDEEIGSPVVTKLDTLCAMNAPSLDKFESWVKAGGTVVVNSSLIERKVKRTDVKVLYVPVNDIALKIGSDKIANMVMLGSYLQASSALPLDIVLETMREKMAKKAKFIPLNEAAIKAGLEYKDAAK